MYRIETGSPGSPCWNEGHAGFMAPRGTLCACGAQVWSCRPLGGVIPGSAVWGEHPRCPRPWAPLCLVWVLPWSKKEPWRLLTPWTLLPTAILVRPRGVKGICPFGSRVLPEYGGVDAQRAPGFCQLWGRLRALLPFPAGKGSSAHPYSTTSQCPWGKRRKSRLCPSLS